MKIDYEQLRKDKETMRETLPCDDNNAWEAWDRISMVLFELEHGRGHSRSLPDVMNDSSRYHHRDPRCTATRRMR